MPFPRPVRAARTTAWDPAPGVRRGAAGLLAVLLVALSLAWLPSPAGADVRRPAARAAANTDPLAIEIESMSPEIPRQGKVRISGTVTNTTDETFASVNLHPFNSHEPITDAATLAASVALDPTEYVGDRIVEPGSFETVTALAPGQSVSFSISIPVAQLGVGAEGVYWIGVHARSGEETYGRARTFIPLAPAPRSRPRTSAAVVVPLRANVWLRPNGSLDHVGRWTRALEEGGRLDRLLSLGEGAGTARVSWLVDPALLAAVTRLAGGNAPRTYDPVPGATPTETPVPTDGAPAAGADAPAPVTPVAPTRPEGEERSARQQRAAQAAQAWLDRFRAVAAEGEVLALPYGDVDVAATVRHDPAVLAAAVARGADVMAQLGIPARSVVAPRTGLLPAAAIAAVPEGTLVLLSDAAAPLAPTDTSTTYTHAGRTIVLTSRGALAGGPAPTAPHQPLALRQRLLSESVLRRTAGSSAPVVLNLPATWDPTEPLPLLSDLETSWLRVRPIGELAAAPAEPLVADQLAYTDDDAAAELPEYVFSRADDVSASADLITQVLSQPTTIRGQLHDEVFVGLSEGRRAHPQESGFRLTETSRSLSELLARVTVEVPRAVTLTSATGPVGVTVVNGIDQPVRVRIDATSDSGLRVTRVEDLSLAPRSRRRVVLQVEATRDGRHDVQVLVTAADGTPLSRGTELPVRSAIVDERVWMVALVGAGVLFVVVVLRIAQRVRRVRAGEPVRPSEPAPDTDDTEAEAGRG